MTSAAHQRQREEDAALFEDWSEWRAICTLQVACRRFIVGPVPWQVEKYLLRIPGAEKAPKSWWRLSLHLTRRGVYVPAVEWRRLRRLLPAIVDYMRDQAGCVTDLHPRKGGDKPQPRDDGRHRRSAFASGDSAPSDFRAVSRIIENRPASQAQRVYIRKLLRRVGRGEETIPELTMQEASEMITGLRSAPHG